MIELEQLRRNSDMASPRQSASLLRSPPSSRTSLDTLGQPSISRVANPNARRNRAALRDYYKLKDQTQDANPADSSRISIADSQATEHLFASASRLDAFDRDDFDAVSHVRKLLETESLKELLALEHELVADVRTLDGERKALVYDNYSKLISASDTIKKVCYTWTQNHLTSIDEIKHGPVVSLDIDSGTGDSPHCRNSSIAFYRATV
jgi:vacuolar protein sorting-associated protein 51